MKTRENTSEENMLIIRCIEAFDYNAETGMLFGKNTAREVGYIHSDGYRMVQLDKKSYFVHRLIFAMNKLYFPVIVDHADRNSLNNKLKNLRDATHSQNMINRKLQVNSTSGHAGVFYDKSKGKWRASIKHHGRRIHIGYYGTKETAAQARREKELELYGEFSNVHRASDEVMEARKNWDVML
jgi:hypothetical protein